MAKQASKNLLISSTILVWAAALALALAGRYQLAAKRPTEVSLTTWPPAVRITVDGDRRFDGDYVVTPLKLQLPAGRHRLTISREGYFAQSSEIEDTTGRKIDMSNVVLQRNNDLVFAPTEFVVDDGELPVQLEIDDGFAGGETPLVVEDLLPDVPHVLVIRGDGERRPVKLRCRFTAEVPAAEAPPTRIRIKTTTTGYRATGCARLKTIKK